MRYCRFQTDAGPRYGRVEELRGRLVVAGLMPAPEEEGYLDSSTPKMTATPLEYVKLLPAVAPRKILCVGRNYRDHASELGNEVPQEPLIFMKPVSSLLAPGDIIRIPDASLTKRVDFEGEVGVVMGKRARNLNGEFDIKEYIRGYTVANDVTARDLQKKDAQWTRAKGFDTFCPVGPFVTDEVDVDKGVDLTTRLNGEEKQHGNTSDFIFSLREILTYITTFLTLEPGDLILTGTPSGVAPMKAGDTVEVTVKGIGTLKNKVGD
jgi:2-keto-4-pentenoate hydratase/2-oxohepta-3-ene-1,7-dioic acid hydratase in catechol pathway